MILCWIWQLSGVHIAWKTDGIFTGSKACLWQNFDLTCTVSDICGSIVELLGKFWKVWLARLIHQVLIFHWNAEILLWVSVFQREGFQESKECTEGSSYCNRTFVWVSDIPISMHNSRPTFLLSAVMSSQFLILEQKVNGASLLFTCCTNFLPSSTVCYVRIRSKNFRNVHNVHVTASTKLWSTDIIKLVWTSRYFFGFFYNVLH
jgi:hypothetical protein